MNSSVTYDKHDESGKFTPTYSPEDFLEAVDELELPTTAEIADTVGCAHRTALHHLNELEEEGHVRSRKAGRAKLWMISEVDEEGDDV